MVPLVSNPSVVNHALQRFVCLVAQTGTILWPNGQANDPERTRRKTGGLREVFVSREEFVSTEVFVSTKAEEEPGRPAKHVRVRAAWTSSGLGQTPQERGCQSGAELIGHVVVVVIDARSADHGITASCIAEVVTEIDQVDLTAH
jgi:hypothetical protein